MASLLPKRRGTTTGRGVLNRQRPSNVNPKLSDVPAVFALLPERYNSEIEVSGTSATSPNLNSHIQGVARYGDFHFFTHSDAAERSGSLLISKGSKLIDKIRVPKTQGRGSSLNHPGGCQRIGGYLVIAVEKIGAATGSLVLFLDISDPYSVKQLQTPAPIPRPNSRAGAAGITNLLIDSVEYWLLAAYDNGNVDFYLSDGNAFPETEFRWLFHAPTDCGHQSFCLLTDTRESVYAIGCGWKNGTEDWADLYSVVPETKSITKIASRHFRTNGLHNVHFRWGCSVDVVSEDSFTLNCTGRVFSRFPANTRSQVIEGGAHANDRADDAPGTTGVEPRCYVEGFSIL